MTIDYPSRYKIYITSVKIVGISPVKTNMTYVYVLRSSSTGNFYTGCTTELRARFKQHTEGLVRFTKGRDPFKLIYYEACTNKLDAYAK